MYPTQREKPNILIINGSKQFGSSQGELNTTLVNTASERLRNLGCQVCVTNLEDHYDTDEEVKKFLWADLVIYQMPVWWMGVPWHVTKYIDEVFDAGLMEFHEEGRAVPQFNRGGRLVNKSYMLSLTWGASADLFTNYSSFLRGATPDSIFFGFHRANEYLGFTALPSFILFDVEKRPKVAHELDRYKRHLDYLLHSALAPPLLRSALSR